MKIIKVKINKPFGRYSIGTIVPVKVDANRIPMGSLGQFWRRRLKDAETDGCCEVVKVSQEKPATSKRKSENKETK